MKYDTQLLTNEFISALETKNLNKIENLFADDIHFEDVPIGVHYGKANAINKVSDFFSKAESIKLAKHRIACQDNIAFVERTSYITLNGIKIVLPMVMVLEFNDDGKIKLFKDYFDHQTLERQFS